VTRGRVTCPTYPSNLSCAALMPPGLAHGPVLVKLYARSSFAAGFPRPRSRTFARIETR